MHGTRDDYGEDFIQDLAEAVETLFQEKTPHRTLAELVVDLLDSGHVRVAEMVGKQGDSVAEYKVNEWVKMGVLMYFQTHDNIQHGAVKCISHQMSLCNYYDKVPLKFEGWDEARFKEYGVRVVPHATVRKGVHIESGAVLMPSYCNIGARIGSGSMIDTWATVGSCAQIGKNCHISGGAGIGGVLGPLQANPVIIEDNCFIGARAEVAEGVIVGQGSVLSMGVYIGKSTPIFDRTTGETYYGVVPPYSVVVPGSRPIHAIGDTEYSAYCAIIMKRVDEQTRSNVAINELLRM